MHVVDAQSDTVRMGVYHIISGTPVLHLVIKKGQIQNMTSPLD